MDKNQGHKEMNITPEYQFFLDIMYDRISEEDLFYKILKNNDLKDFINLADRIKDIQKEYPSIIFDFTIPQTLFYRNRIINNTRFECDYCSFNSFLVVFFEDNEKHFNELSMNTLILNMAFSNLEDSQKVNRLL